MAHYRDLDITVIYSEDGVVSSPAKPRRRVSTGRRAGAGRLLGTLTLLVAAGWLYVTWFPASHFLRTSLIEATFNLPGLIDLEQLLGFKPPPAELANPAPPESESLDDPMGEMEDSRESAVGSAEQPDVRSPEALAQQRDDSRIALRRLMITKYAWIVVMTAVACALAMAGGAGVGGWLAGPGSAGIVRLFAVAMLVGVGIIAWKCWPRLGEAIPEFPETLQYAYAGGFLLAAWGLCASWSKSGVGWFILVGLVGLVVLCGGAWCIWRTYGEGWPIRATQTFWFAALVIAALTGAAFSTHLRGLIGLSIVLVLLSCVATAVGMWYGQHNGGFVTFRPTGVTYLKVLAIQSAFAWVLLVTRRMVRVG
ncbi:MAG: hypothetical protein KAV82_08815 [Phycisphaerae bacterium]|nr:hypothetical protein [Phycisphaerae bacterium]